MEKQTIKIVDKTKCCGCRACGSVCPQNAIRFTADAYGFFYPEVDETKCVQCGLCMTACTYGDTQSTNQTLPLKACAAAHLDAHTLKRSSSGGVFSALASYALKRGGAVCGCILDDKLRPVHVCTEDPAVVRDMCGSKYAQSDTNLIYQEVKKRVNAGQFVLFTGTPCQVAGLYSVLKDRRPKNLLTVDLICHGVPSTLMFHKYIEYLEQKHKTKIVHFNFRSKKYGWQRWTTEYTDNRGRKKNIGKVDEFYIPAFTTGNLMRPSCFSCKYAKETRVGDITVGDLWGQEKHALSMPVKNGVSLCTFNTENALDVFQAVSEYMNLEEIDYQLAVKGNHCLHAPTQKGNKWEKYMQAIKEDRISDMAHAYIRTHRKIILRNRIKLRVPLTVFNHIRQKKYG